MEKMMRDEFIRFPKDNHAFEEYKQEIAPHQIEALENDMREMSDKLLMDGYALFYKDAETTIDWGLVEQRWMTRLEEMDDE